jgi:hypothetical protein
MLKYQAPDLIINTTGGMLADNKTVWTRVDAQREFLVESELKTSEGLRMVTFKQELQFINSAEYADDGWLQVGMAKQMNSPQLMPRFSGLIKRRMEQRRLFMEAQKDCVMHSYTL